MLFDGNVVRSDQWVILSHMVPILIISGHYDVISKKLIKNFTITHMTHMIWAIPRGDTMIFSYSFIWPKFFQLFWNDVIVTGNDQKWYNMWQNDPMITSNHVSAKKHIVGVSLTLIGKSWKIHPNFRIWVFLIHANFMSSYSNKLWIFFGWVFQKSVRKS